MIEYCRVVMGVMFSSVLKNQLIEKNSITKNVKCKSRKMPKETGILTIKE